MLVPILTMLAIVAAGPAADKAQKAERLFREGRALLKADLPQQACPKFRQSHELLKRCDRQRRINYKRDRDDGR